MNKNIIKIVANIFILTGSLLLMINIIGIFHYTTINEANPHILDESPTQISEQEFWDNAYRKNGETIEVYVNRLNALVSDRMLLIDPKYAKPTFFENYILWAYSQHLNYYEWKNTKKAVRLGGGFCSQHAIVFNNILREQKIVSRILGLGGHVLNEVLIEGKWKVHDPDYNVIFGVSLKDLESNPKEVYQAYKNAGRPEDEAKYWQEVFGSDTDNWYFQSSIVYSVLGFLIETLSFFLIWILPIAFILIGILIKKYRLTTRSLHYP